MNPARPHHYTYAHRLLPNLFHHDPGVFLGTLRRKGTPFLHDLWEHLGANLEGAEALPPQGLRLEFRDLPDGRSAALVVLPPVQGMPEAHFVAMAPQEDKARYITLEHSIDPASEEPSTMLCEWTADGTHCNMGPGLPPDPDDFFASVADLLSR